jgi:hypothetical protein
LQEHSTKECKLWFNREFRFFKYHEKSLSHYEIETRSRSIWHVADTKRTLPYRLCSLSADGCEGFLFFITGRLFSYITNIPINSPLNFTRGLRNRRATEVIIYICSIPRVVSYKLTITIIAGIRQCFLS